VSDYIINGHEMPCPTTGRWVARRPIDIQGDGRPIYAPVRNFEMRWELQYYEDWEVLVASFDALQSTGTAVVELPAYPTATGVAFGFQEYSGCTLGEPTVTDMYIQEFPTNVALVIMNIRTQ